MTGGQRIAADIGGTFTDIAYVTEAGALVTHKLPSTPANYADGVVAGIGRLLQATGVAPEAVGEVLHGTTVATNAILEHKGARTALVTTLGFRDVLELRRIRVPRLYEPLYEKPPPLVPRHLRLEVAERMGPRGEVVRPLEVADAERVAARLAALEVEAVAVCLLHSYANPAHERALGAILRAALPGRFVSLSVEVLPQLREYERTSTTVINAYVGPPVARYLGAMGDSLAAAGIRARLMVMQSSGGVLEAGAVASRPAEIVECGPAAGVIGAAHVGLQSGYPNLITLDMGGTTAKASIVEQGRVATAEQYEVGADISSSGPMGGGGGYALKLPAIDISEVGAGGGSLVRLDRAGAIKVGPESAGAVPGPACYGRGGEVPTVTDANVVLGYLNPEALAGGSVAIDAGLARRAVEAAVARPLGRDAVAAAYGIHAVANASMMRAVKAVTTYRGRDPRAFALFAFGGNGGVHGVELARALQIREVIVPPAAGVFSAVGLLFAAMEMNVARACLVRLAALPLAEAEATFRAIMGEIAAQMGRPEGAIAFTRLADMRYAGQAFELTVALPPGPLDDGALRALAEAFEAEHERRYGHRFAGAYPLEVVNLRVIGSVTPPGERRLRPAARPAAAAGRREVHFGPRLGTRATPVIDRAALDRTARPGPFVVEEYEGTTLVPPDCTARLDRAGNIVVALPAAG